MNILQYESKIWETADLLRGSGIKESEWTSYMMPYFALAMIESRLIRMYDEFKSEIGENTLATISKDELRQLIRDKGQGYNVYIFEHNKTLTDICKNDKSFDIDFEVPLQKILVLKQNFSFTSRNIKKAEYFSGNIQI